MPGGEIQIGAQGAQDLYLTGNPQISFFKAVYKRYTNFAQQLIELDDDSSNNTLSSFNEIVTLKYKIPRNADLIKEIYMQVKLPAIYSNDTKQFKWIRRIGEYMIKEIRIVGGDSRVYNRIRGEYLHIYSELHTSESKKQQYYKMIGHLPELYDPANANMLDGLYPTRTKPLSGTTGIPSIPAINLTVPIPFWFNQHSGLEFPLIALQQMAFRIEVDIRPLNELYTIIDTNPDNTNTFRTRIRPLNSEDYLSSYTNESLSNVLDSTVVSLYCNYIFLDREERKRFAQVEHRYLMKQMQYNENIVDLSGGGNFNLDMKDINQPVTQFFFMARRIDNETTNQWSNYTLWEYGSKELENPLSSSFISEYNNQFTISDTVNTDLTVLNTEDIITTVELMLNATSRFERQDIEFFKVNRHNHNKENGNLDGIYGYSFSIDNDKFQPSGSCNFSRIGKKELRLNFKKINQFTRKSGATFTGYYRIMLIAENINYLRIIGGLAGVEFIN